MSTNLTKKNIIVGTDTQIQNRYANDPEGTIYLSTTKSKTYYDKELSIQTSSSGTGGNYRPTLGFKNYNGDEVGSVQFHVGNNQMVFATNEQNEPGIQLALRAYNSSNAYSAKLPLTADKATAIGSGDVTLPLAISMGGTTYTANSGGLITLPGGGGGGGGYLHNIIFIQQGSGAKVYTLTVIDDVQDYSTTFATNAMPQEGSDLYNLLDELGIILTTTPGSPLPKLSPIYSVNPEAGGIEFLYFRPSFGFYSVAVQASSDGTIGTQSSSNITQAKPLIVADTAIAL